MYVTKDKNLTTEEIRELSEEELKEMFQARLEDWFIKPMEILDQHEHTGFAVAYLLKQVIVACGIWNKHLLSSFDLLHEENVFVSGDPQEVFTLDATDAYLVVNPHKAVERARYLVKKAAESLNTATFRLFLIKKSKLR